MLHEWYLCCDSDTDFLMGGTEIVPGVIWNAIVPFFPNPWY